MGIMKIVQTILRNSYAEITKPTRVRKGEEFEKFTRDEIFTNRWYERTHKTHSFQENKGDYITDSLLPDYQFKDRTTNRKFWVECKYISEIYDKTYLCSKEQLNRYKSMKEETFIFVGTSGKASEPNELYLIPVKFLKYNEIYYSYLEKFQIENREISTYKLWSQRGSLST